MQQPLLSPALVRAGTSILLAAVVVLCLRAPLNEFRHGIFALGDLRAFYCAARVTQSGADPYRAEPLGDCERATAGLRGSNFVVPAPLPGHALALFELLARLPFAAVAGLWCALLCTLLVAIATLLARLVAWPLTSTLAACLPLAFMIPIDTGQLVPVSVALLLAATICAVHGRDRSAALLAAAATIEPQLGLPVCVAVFLGRPRSRPALAGAAIALAALSVHTVGFAATVEYIARVLPLHIAAEARYDDQYSLTYGLSSLGAAPAVAIALGQASYWLGTIVAVSVALVLKWSTRDVRYLFLVPMAFSVTGGPYVHEEHLLAAVPLALFAAARAPRERRAIALSVLALIAWPAKFVLDKLQVAGFPLHIVTGTLSPEGSPPLLADAAWAMRVDGLAGHALSFAAKVPTWIGLIVISSSAMLGAAAACAAHAKLWSSRHSGDAAKPRSQTIWGVPSAAEGIRPPIDGLDKIW